MKEQDVARPPRIDAMNSTPTLDFLGLAVFKKLRIKKLKAEIRRDVRRDKKGVKKEIICKIVPRPT